MNATIARRSEAVRAITESVTDGAIVDVCTAAKDLQAADEKDRGPKLRAVLDAVVAAERALASEKEVEAVLHVLLEPLPPGVTEPPSELAGLVAALASKSRPS